MVSWNSRDTILISARCPADKYRLLSKGDVAQRGIRCRAGIAGAPALKPALLLVDHHLALGPEVLRVMRTLHLMSPGVLNRGVAVLRGLVGKGVHAQREERLGDECQARVRRQIHGAWGRFELEWQRALPNSQAV